MLYDEMLITADGHGLVTKEKDLLGHDGLIKDRNIAIRQTIPTNKQKACVLAEEIGHAVTSAGNIMDYEDDNAWRQEVRARTYGYDLLVGPDNLIKAFEHGCRNLYEMSEFLDVTVSFLTDAIERYHQKYGFYQKHKNYLIMYEPTFAVVKLY